MTRSGVCRASALDSIEQLSRPDTITIGSDGEARSDAVLPRLPVPFQQRLGRSRRFQHDMPLAQRCYLNNLTDARWGLSVAR